MSWSFTLLVLWLSVPLPLLSLVSKGDNRSFLDICFLQSRPRGHATHVVEQDAPYIYCTSMQTRDMIHDPEHPESREADSMPRGVGHRSAVRYNLCLKSQVLVERLNFNSSFVLYTIYSTRSSDIDSETTLHLSYICIPGPPNMMAYRFAETLHVVYILPSFPSSLLCCIRTQDEPASDESNHQWQPFTKRSLL